MPTYQIADDVALRRVVSYLPSTDEAVIEQNGTGWALTVPSEHAVAAQAGVDAVSDFVPVPQIVTMAQARRAMLAAGILDSVVAALEADTSPQGAINRITFEYEVDVRRFAPLIAAMSGSLGLSSGQVDNLFRLAATL